MVAAKEESVLIISVLSNTKAYLLGFLNLEFLFDSQQGIIERIVRFQRCSGGAALHGERKGKYGVLVFF